jgi:outer membrane biogenesis lipoprotein LolB
MADMRLLLALFATACLWGCGAQQSQSEHELVRYNDEWRQKQAVLDAEAILQGMAQARQRQEQMARSAR